MKIFVPVKIVALVCLTVLCSLQTEAFGLKKGLKVLGPLALIGGAAGAGALGGALLGSHHQHEPVHHVKHVKHIHVHPIEHVKYVHHEPVHTVKVIEHGWDGGWHGASSGGDDGWW